MTRTVVVQEGTDYGHSIIELGACKPVEDVIPVLYGDAVVGTARDFQRDEATGEISFELEFATAEMLSLAEAGHVEYSASGPADIEDRIPGSEAPRVVHGWTLQAVTTQVVYKEDTSDQVRIAEGSKLPAATDDVTSGAGLHST